MKNRLKAIIGQAMDLAGYTAASATFDQVDAIITVTLHSRDTSQFRRPRFMLDEDEIQTSDDYLIRAVYWNMTGLEYDSLDDLKWHHSKAQADCRRALRDKLEAQYRQEVANKRANELAEKIRQMEEKK